METTTSHRADLRRLVAGHSSWGYPHAAGEWRPASQKKASSLGLWRQEAQLSIQ